MSAPGRQSAVVAYRKPRTNEPTDSVCFASLSHQSQNNSGVVIDTALLCSVNRLSASDRRLLSTSLKVLRFEMPLRWADGVRGIAQAQLGTAQMRTSMSPAFLPPIDDRVCVLVLENSPRRRLGQAGALRSEIADLATGCSLHSPAAFRFSAAIAREPSVAPMSTAAGDVATASKSEGVSLEMWECCNATSAMIHTFSFCSCSKREVNYVAALR